MQVAWALGEGTGVVQAHAKRRQGVKGILGVFSNIGTYGRFNHFIVSTSTKNRTGNKNFDSISMSVSFTTSRSFCHARYLSYPC